MSLSFSVSLLHLHGNWIGIPANVVSQCAVHIIWVTARLPHKYPTVCVCVRHWCSEDRLNEIVMKNNNRWEPKSFHNTMARCVFHFFCFLNPKWIFECSYLPPKITAIDAQSFANRIFQFGIQSRFGQYSFFSSTVKLWQSPDNHLQFSHHSRTVNWFKRNESQLCNWTLLQMRLRKILMNEN